MDTLTVPWMVCRARWGTSGMTSWTAAGEVPVGEAVAFARADAFVPAGALMPSALEWTDFALAGAFALPGGTVDASRREASGVVGAEVDSPATGAPERFAFDAAIAGSDVGFVPNKRMPPQTTAITTTTASASDTSDRRG